MSLHSARVLGCVIVVLVAGCRPRVPCSDAAPCPVDYYCLPDHLGDMICMEQCDPDVDRALCVTGALCVQNGLGTGFCWSGGPVPIGGECEVLRDCQYGSVCVGPELGMIGPAYCREACELDGSLPCSDSQRCAPTTDPRYGFCEPRF